MKTTEINWSYNCLTVGIHHGRPERLWNLPLLQAAQMFSGEDLKDLVVSRIYADALIYVHSGDEPRPTEKWAERVKELAEKRYLRIFQSMIGEISRYYQMPEHKRELHDAVVLVKDNGLGRHYQPLHSHDSINMLCRILGTSSSAKISLED
jgi:hypothetical protein